MGKNEVYMNKLVNKIFLILSVILVTAGQGFAAWDGTVATTAPGDTTIDGKNFYKISNEKELAWFAAQVNATSKGKANPHSNINAILMADMDMTGHLWTPIAAGKGDTRFGGIIDGNGHKIVGIYINGEELAAIENNGYCNGVNPAVPGCNAQNLGFVGTLGGGTIKNLILENVDIHASTNAGTILTNQDQQISVGAFVGWMADKNVLGQIIANKDSNVVENCMVTGTIKTTGNSQGVGGIVGNAKVGTISNCMSLIDIQASGSKAHVGGIIGITKTDIAVSSCVYAGPGLTNTGANGSVGGIAGNVASGTITAEDSFYEGDGITYNNKPISGVGKDCGAKCTVTDSTVNTSEINEDSVACALNGIDTTTAACKTEPWSVGETSLSLNGYGADGYKIVFDANGGAFANGKSSKNKFLDGGMAITADEVENPTRENFSFAGWAKTRDSAVPAANLGTVSKSDTVFAVWTPVYTVTFNVAPGVFPESNESEKTKQVISGETITVEGLGTLPSSRCKNYVSGSEDECETWSYFTGWALTAGAPESDSVSLDTVTASDGLVLHAVWTDVETYTVTYNANKHGTTTVDYVRVGAGDTVSAPTDPIANDGYVFAGWFTDSNGVNEYEFTSQITQSIILYAKWTLQRFNISYVMNEGTDTGDNPGSYTIDTSFALKAPADIEGYEFEGWFYDAAFTNKATQVILGTTGDKTFYGKWSKKTYRVMYLADNSSYGSITDQFVEHGTTINLESAGIFRRAGYNQNGWSTTMGGAKEYEFGESVTVVAPVTLYPTWSLATYTITYECDGCVNNPANPTTYTYKDNKSIKFAQAPEGYSFAGWFTEPDFQTQITQITQIVKKAYGDITLYGKQLELYTITYVGTDNPYGDKTYTVESAAQLRGCAPRDGYTFAGWYDNADFEGDAVTEVPVGSIGNKTFYAKWNKVYPFVTQSGAVTITEYEDGTKSAVINGTYGGGDVANPDEADTVQIATDVVVNSVVLNRTFNENKVATLYLPFEIDTANINGATIYKFKTVVKSEEDGRWKFKVTKAAKVLPNTPYVALPSASQVTFDIPESVTLNTTTAGEEAASGAWEFRGVYTYTVFTADPENPVYFFADQVRDGAKLGEFVITGTGAWLNPMRAYLIYHKGGLAKSARGNLGSNIMLPDELDIVVEDENGIVVETGRLNTVTGEVRMDRWFDLKGRKLNSKPTVKGTYYKNGKRVIIK